MTAAPTDRRMLAVAITSLAMLTPTAAAHAGTDGIERTDPDHGWYGPMSEPLGGHDRSPRGHRHRPGDGAGPAGHERSRLDRPAAAAARAGHPARRLRLADFVHLVRARGRRGYRAAGPPCRRQLEDGAHPPGLVRRHLGRADHAPGGSRAGALPVAWVRDGRVLATGEPATLRRCRVNTYSVRTRGKVTADVAQFARLVAQTYADDRGWAPGLSEVRAGAHRGRLHALPRPG